MIDPSVIGAHSVFYDDGGDTAYWVAWSDDDNPQGKDTEPMMYRVFREDRVHKPTPITEAMSKAEAVKKLIELAYLIKGS